MSGAKGKPAGEAAKPELGGPAAVRHIRAGEFKAVCLALMDRVKETGEEYVITKRGQPVAKLMRVEGAEDRPFIGRSRGVISAAREDLLAPLGEDWEVDADL